MSDIFGFLFVAALWILTPIAVIAICIGILRWVFKIDYIIDILEDIRDGRRGNRPLRPEDKIKCDGCEAYFEIIKMMKIDSGQNLCPKCFEKFKN